MPWGIAGNWLAVAGLLFLTFGTSAQALANLAEYKSIRQRLATVYSISTLLGIGGFLGFAISIVSELFLTQAKLRRVRATGGDEAVEFVRFLRLAAVWTILTIGSFLTLTAAVIQLALAYQ